MLDHQRLSTCCKILDLNESFDEQKLSSAFRKCLKETHPDTCAEKNAEEITRSIIESYTYLKSILENGETFISLTDQRKAYPKFFDSDLIPAGHTQFECNTCSGKGFRIMPGFVGHTTCPECDGFSDYFSEIDMFFTRGRRGSGRSTEKCNRCNGMQTILQKKQSAKMARSIMCPNCKGRGTFRPKCKKCVGVGFILKSNPDQIYECKTCKGTGQIVKQLFNPVFIKGSLSK